MQTIEQATSPRAGGPAGGRRHRRGRYRAGHGIVDGFDPSAPLLEVEHLAVTFAGERGPIHSVRDVSFTVEAGTITGLVGESGSGKTVSGLALLGLHPTDRTTYGGVVRYRGVDILGRSEDELRDLRGPEIAMIFQEPMTALNPVRTIGSQVSEGILTHTRSGKAAARSAAVEMLGHVGIPEPRRSYDKYPHQLSGGLRQRAMIAAAIACKPRLLIADEPTTALDVTIQAQVLRLILGLAQEDDMAVVLVTHDLGVIAQVATNVVTMYAGEVVERGVTADVLQRPRHPYTRRLLEARPSLTGDGSTLRAIPGSVPSPESTPAGCLFAPRCDIATAACTEGPTALVGDRRDAVRCIHAAPTESGSDDDR
ncbi:MAG: ABC transporter ATP-binding protein [Ilumatobacteraceae bacterium]